MNNHDPNASSNYLMYVNVNNLYRWAIRKKLPIDNFERDYEIDKFTSNFNRNYNEHCDTWYLLEVDIASPENLHESHRYLPFLPVAKDKLLTTLDDKRNYIVTISTLKQALDHGLSLQKVHRVISFRQEAWLKPYIDKNTKLRKCAKNNFEKDFFKLMNNAVFRKTIENVSHRSDVK